MASCNAPFEVEMFLQADFSSDFLKGIRMRPKQTKEIMARALASGPKPYDRNSMKSNRQGHQTQRRQGTVAAALGLPKNFAVKRSQNFVLSGTNTMIHPIEMHSGLHFLSEFAHDAGMSLACRWLKDGEGKVGVMLAANAGRPGGACIKYPESEFKLCLHAKTQEESVLSYISKYFNAQDEIEDKLLVYNERYRMRPARTEIDVIRERIPTAMKNNTSPYPELDRLVFDGEKDIDILKAGPEFYRRNFGFWVQPNIGRQLLSFVPPTPWVYLSFVAGPNANTKLRFSEFLNSMDRTVSQVGYNADDFYPAYTTFKDMVFNAVTSSLTEMLRQGVQRAVIAGVSCQLYAGVFEKKIQQDFFQLCLEALEAVYDKTKDKGYGQFTDVIIPDFNIPDPF